MPLTDTGLPTADLQCLSADRVMEWAGWYADPCPIRSYSPIPPMTVCQLTISKLAY